MDRSNQQPTPGGSTERPTIVFAGGGTGGHVYPGLAIAERIASLSPNSRRMFVCSDRPLDSEILKKEGVEFHPIGAKPFGVRPRALARFLRSWGRSVRESRRLLRDAEGSSRGCVVVAMGGFVAAPVAQAARVEGVPVILVNLDAAPGKANRWIAGRLKRQPRCSVVSTIPVADGGEAWPVVGPVVRQRAMGTSRPASCRSLGLDPDRHVLMVTGGSQGAKSINGLALALVRARPELFAKGRGWQVLHQAGKDEADQVSAAYRDLGVDGTAVAFSDRMGDWWCAATLAISRAGAGSVAEAWANRTPTVFLPYPYHKDEHQRLNAEPLEAVGAARVFKDRVDPSANLQEAGSAIIHLMEREEDIAGMWEALEKLGPADGAARVAAMVLDAVRAGTA